MKHITIILFFFSLSHGTEKRRRREKEAYTLNLTDLKQVGEVDERYQSFNVEMCEVVGGDFWIPYDLLDPEKAKAGGFAALKRTIPPVNLYDNKLRTLASALGTNVYSGERNMGEYHLLSK